jgi:Fe2+ transport system protein FeoA
MGLVPGVPVRVLQNNAPGPVIVAVKDTRLCLGRGVANKVMVSPDGGAET